MDSPESSDLEISVVPPSILDELGHLDLSAYVEFQERRVVCGGAYGDVSKLRCALPNRGKIKVAVKRLRFYMKDDITKLFAREIYVWSKLDHPNILPLLGFAFDKRTNYPLLVSEWMENRSASDYVQVHPECDLIALVAGIADGLAYLHNRGIIHSDIKPNNILVSDTGNALICDFGCARMIDASVSMANLSSGLKGTIRYLAYEILAEENKDAGYSEKSDVWAFGMTELLTLQRPYHQHTHETQVALAVIALKLPSLPESAALDSRGLRPEERDVLWDICQSCWIHKPDARANMTSILNKLYGLRGTRGMALMQNEQDFLSGDATTTLYTVSSNETVTYDRLERVQSVEMIKTTSRSSEKKRKTLSRLGSLFRAGRRAKSDNNSDDRLRSC